MRRLMILVGAAGGLVACATAAQRQYQTMSSNAKAASQAVRECTLAVYNAPESASLRVHFPFNVNMASLEQLSDTSLISEEEKQAVLNEHPKLQACREAFLTQLSQTTPSIAAIIADAYAQSENSLVDLLQKKQSWGDHLRRVKSITADTKIRTTEESQKIVAGLNRSHEAELTRRQAASAALMQYYQTQQIINNMNRPVVTNCTAFGSMANCVTQ